jgi:myo-inositol-1(or 4)-monophosphatase
MHPMLSTAVKAARRAGAIINRASLDAGSFEITRKRQNDFVTEVDQAAESAIIDIIQRAYPDHDILAEESGAIAGTGVSKGDAVKSGAVKSAGKEGAASEYTWIIDPLDGTTNFIHGFPQYAVSIGLRHRDTIAHGVIYDPGRNELFTASRGRGAFLNERRIRVSRRAKLDEALIGTGFPYRDLRGLNEYMGMLRAVIAHTVGIRRAGAASLDLAYVAAGRLDAFWEVGLSPWDMAAGALMIQEAGGLVGELGRDMEGGPGFLESGRIIAGNPKVFSQLLQLIGPLSRAD